MMTPIARCCYHLCSKPLSRPFFALLLAIVNLLLVNWMVSARLGEQVPTQAAYPFQNPHLPIEQRVANIISLLTLDEKIACLSTDPSVPRLGIKGSRHVEGIHGLAQGRPGECGRPNTVPTTTFPQG